MRLDQTGFPVNPQHRARLRDFIGRALHGGSDPQGLTKDYPPLAFLLETATTATADKVDAETLRALLGMSLEWIASHHWPEVSEVMNQATSRAKRMELQ